MSDWEGSDDGSPARAVPSKVAPKGKWEGEDEDDDGPVVCTARLEFPFPLIIAIIAERWEASSEEEVKDKPAATAAAPPKKKGTLKQKLAEKEAARRAQLAAGGSEADYDEDAVLNPREKARLRRSASSRPISDKPLYATFVEHHARALAQPLRDVDVRKAASGLTTLANEKQREKASGKKKPKSTAKPVLGASKVGNKLDTTVYDEALDDFGTNPDDLCEVNECTPALIVLFSPTVAIHPACSRIT
ncbi:hypothetical protein EI94DRAFT_1797358 [Lactarius quietus]|nr:hypothetical protein EI94DRAFT_1797358 [Lactarius quietus]